MALPPLEWVIWVRILRPPPTIVKSFATVIVKMVGGIIHCRGAGAMNMQVIDS